MSPSAMSNAPPSFFGQEVLGPFLLDLAKDKLQEGPWCGVLNGVDCLYLHLCLLEFSPQIYVKVNLAC